mmetsp:Transcript_18202/g.23976  ORF Transcript_18202/g.23976 Transcript_18202/m.23976 type:complete len:100 (+) Transcript_18202:1156-1455(+)
MVAIVRAEVVMAVARAVGIASVGKRLEVQAKGWLVAAWRGVGVVGIAAEVGGERAGLGHRFGDQMKQRPRIAPGPEGLEGPLRVGRRRSPQRLQTGLEQ